MDRFTLLSLIVLEGFLVPFALSTLIAGKKLKLKNVTNDPVNEESVPADGYGKPVKVFLPNVLARWPWQRRLHPSYATVKKASDAWMTNLQAFSPKAQDAFNRCDFDLFACLVYANASKERVRVGCDFMHLLFIFDEYFERFTPSQVRQQKDVIMDALRNPQKPRPKGEWIGGEATRQFWERAMKNATEVSQKRFIAYMDECLESATHESMDRMDHHVLDVRSYIDARRLTSAVKPSFSIIELGLDIPDDVMAHPSIQEMVLAAVDMIAIWNDMISYNVEQQRDDVIHNLVTCVMHEYCTDVNGALMWCANFILGAEERFLAAMTTLPEWDEPLNSHVKAYCDGLGQWVRGNYDWSFESERYLGSHGREIKDNRWMFLLPKKSASEIGPMHVDSFLM